VQVPDRTTDVCVLRSPGGVRVLHGAAHCGQTCDLSRGRQPGILRDDHGGSSLDPQAFFSVELPAHAMTPTCINSASTSVNVHPDTSVLSLG
jgi:hypothetical protein